MPSLNDSRRYVEQSLAGDEAGVDHDAVLASLQEEIDRHNGVKDNLRRSMRSGKHREEQQVQHSSQTSRRFRFKEHAGDDTERRERRRNRHERHRHAADGEENRRRKKRRRREAASTPEQDQEDPEAAHPFPREPTDPSKPNNSTDDAAFRDSLFDALADDEGAAYWESVYSQPIHVYSRPTVQTPQGQLEQMTDEDYAAYVKTKMWEQNHPEIMLERERSERRRREEEEEKTRRREEFVRRKEQAAWERSQGYRPRRTEDNDSDMDADERYKYKFAGGKKWSSDNPSSSAQGTSRAQREEYANAWSGYLAAWEKLKHELLRERQQGAASPATSDRASKRIPWPVLKSKPVIKANIEDFMRHAPIDNDMSLTQTLKAERVRWHPDKVQQRFGGVVDDGTMKLVTGVFQIVDALLDEEKKRMG